MQAEKASWEPRLSPASSSASPFAPPLAKKTGCSNSISNNSSSCSCICSSRCVPRADIWEGAAGWATWSPEIGAGHPAHTSLRPSVSTCVCPRRDFSFGNLETGNAQMSHSGRALQCCAGSPLSCFLQAPIRSVPGDFSSVAISQISSELHRGNKAGFGAWRKRSTRAKRRELPSAEHASQNPGSLHQHEQRPVGKVLHPLVILLMVE